MTMQFFLCQRLAVFVGLSLMTMATAAQAVGGSGQSGSEGNQQIGHGPPVSDQLSPSIKLLLEAQTTMKSHCSEESIERALS